MRWLTPSPALPPLVQSHFLPLLAGRGASDRCVWDSLDTPSICVCELASQQAFFTNMLSESLFNVSPLQTLPLRLSKQRWNFDEIVLHLVWHDVNMLWSVLKQLLGSMCHTNAIKWILHGIEGKLDISESYLTHHLFSHCGPQCTTKLCNICAG